MRRSRNLITAATLPALAIGCAAPVTGEPFNVTVRGPATACTIEVEGRGVTTEELLEIARPEAKPGRRARIDLDMAQTPYRCLGGVIYTLQSAGFEDLSFVAEPPTVR